MSTIKGIFEPFDPNIVDQLNKRKEILSTRGGSNPELFYAYTTQKQCIIRMVSGVDLRESANEELLEPDEKGKKLDNNLAKQYILEGGTRFFGDGGDFSGIREGFTTGNIEDDKIRGFSYGDKNIRANADDGFGVVPMPGIVDATIRTKSDDGSLREASVNFTCHNRRQLEVLETLYMRPGYPILLEWGWNPYISNEGTIENNDNTITTEFFKAESDLHKLNNEIRKKKFNSGGNYDGFIGYCKNFDFTAREDGGYDCTTEIMAHGEILESLKVKKVSRKTGRLIGEDPEIESMDSLLFYFRAIKKNLDKAGDARYLKYSGTDSENVDRMNEIRRNEEDRNFRTRSTAGQGSGGRF